ncbi:hypothetical protein CesoFtcFv8_017145 [Champsocephalus esox]|uniref:Uncharacterized protein n=1 Tax=Champsocephalus esox TaxID=159716 RepID=A0AAN8BJK0_9TELE|nr:hypothetical protein CesoFtcFv8_017145 [Champsocephalus esox]
MAFIFSRNECEPPFLHPAEKNFPEMGSSTWVRGLGNRLPSRPSPSRSSSGRPQALLAQARPPISRALTGNQSLMLAGNMRWGGELGRSMRACGSPDAWPALTAHTHL